MKKTLITSLALGILSIGFMFLYFLASTDIYHDYVGKNTFASGKIISNLKPLPEWTSCKTEWTILQIDFVIRIIFMILITIVLIKLILYPKKQS